MKRFALIGCFGLLFSLSSVAQEVPRFTFNMGGGFTNAVGNTGRHLDEGWNIQGAAGVNFNAYVGALVQLDYNRFGINTATLSNIGVPDGNMQVFSATIDPIVHLNPHGPVDVYLIGGGGLYHRRQEFTQPGAATVIGFDPFFGFYPTVIPVNQILGEYTVNKPGVNGGMGISFGHLRSGKFFAEARYHRIFMGNFHTDYVPVTFGFRW